MTEKGELGCWWFYSKERDKIEPLEERFNLSEAGCLEEVAVLFKGTGDKDIFQGLSLFGNFQFGIAALFFELMIDFDITAIEAGVMGDDLFAENENTAGTETLVNSSQKRFPVQRANELEGVIEEKGGGPGLVYFGDISIDKVEAFLSGKKFGLEYGLIEHGRRVVYPQVVEFFFFKNAA